MDKVQYKLMKKLSEIPEFTIDQKNEEFSYLRSQGYFLQRMENGQPIFKVSPKGRDAMWTFKLGYYRWWVGIVISIAAVIISLIALLK